MNTIKTTHANFRQGSSRDLFKKHFGREIESYAAYQRAIDGLGIPTISGYNDILPRFFIYLNKDPDSVIQERQQDIIDSNILNAERYERIIKTYVKEIESQGFAAKNHLNRIQGFFANNGRRLSLDMRNLKLSKEGKKRKHSPTQNQVKKLYSLADSARDKFIVAVAFQNGVLPVDIANLKVGEYPIEPWVYYKKPRSKTGKTWHGVSTPEACEHLNAYMQLKKFKQVQKLAPREFLLQGREGSLTATRIKELLTELIMKAGLNNIVGFTPKCLRDGFEDALVDAEIYHKVKEAMMGHGGNIEHAYGSAKKLEERILEAMKKAYPLLSLTDTKTDAKINGLDTEKLALLLDNFDLIMQTIKDNANKDS